MRIPTTSFDIFCDESCHLEHDHQEVMTLGAVWCPSAATAEVSRDIRSIKREYGTAPSVEFKWVKASPSRLPLYLALIDYFFDRSDLHFRGMVISPKSRLIHAAFNQDHDTWYFKMYFELLKILIDASGSYRVFLDVKDTRSAHRVEKLRDVLCNNLGDFQRECIPHIQTVDSREVQQVQLADLIIGAIGYGNRGLDTSPAKLALVDHIRARSGYSLTRTTPLGETKFNLFCWEPRQPRDPSA
jgi:hypothetical protein